MEGVANLQCIRTVSAALGDRGPKAAGQSDARADEVHRCIRRPGGSSLRCLADVAVAVAVAVGLVLLNGHCSLVFLFKNVITTAFFASLASAVLIPGILVGMLWFMEYLLYLLS